jgi:hypothetical protein
MLEFALSLPGPPSTTEEIINTEGKHGRLENEVHIISVIAMTIVLLEGWEGIAGVVSDWLRKKRKAELQAPDSCTA